jgi:anaerobic magnesium-protoporphyrin IX monomethyl ester cyclase
MFKGTYNSEFYRAVRNLLHDQVNLEQRRLTHDRRDYAHGRRLLESRWNELIAHERHFRSVLRPAAATG